ncbi:MAG: hypothetical protein DBX55_04085 [Verrucomicrobia bacterium]|nr:MAG: hypothetical protein DBX55_04085 [Verrucomicrobiota bacterium]
MAEIGRDAGGIFLSGRAFLKCARNIFCAMRLRGEMGDSGLARKIQTDFGAPQQTSEFFKA